MNKWLILITDDEPQIRKLLQINLESNDYKVIQASTGNEGIAMCASHTPDLVLLDIGLPDKSGQEVLKELREWYHNPIIMLSVLDGEKEIIAALDHGATDYLTKPFRAGELLARIRSAIKRNITTVNTQSIICGDLEIDLVSRIIKKNNELLKLTSTEYNLLALFAKNEGRDLTHQYILREIWGLGYHTETQYLRVFVGALRKKIEADYTNPLHIITESGVGYRFQ